MYIKIVKIWLAKVCMFNFKTVYPAQFSKDFNNMDFKYKLGYKVKEILKIKQKTFVVLLIKRPHFFKINASQTRGLHFFICAVRKISESVDNIMIGRTLLVAFFYDDTSLKL